MKIDEQGLKDLVTIYGRIYAPQAVPELLQDLRGILPLIEKADTPDGEQACVEALMQKSGPKPFELSVRRSIRELLHYPPEVRGTLLDAALARVDPVADNCHSLDEMHGAVLAEFQRLEERTRAILVVLEELRYAGNNFTNTPYHDVPDKLGSVNVDILRGEPGLKTTMRAYDIAVAVSANRID